MEEKIEFQYIMDNRVYRRKMIASRVIITCLVAGASVAFLLMELVLGILFPIVVLFIGAVWVIVGLQSEMTYTIYNTRFVIKNKDKRVSVPLENITAVKYRSAFYERDMLTGTITITAKDPENGRKKKYKMKHVFNGKEGADRLAAAINATTEKEGTVTDEKD